MSAKPTLVQLILNATTAGKAMLTAANAAAQKTLLSLVKGDVGLGNVDNTSDVNKPISSAQQTALDAKQATLVSGTNIKTVNSTSLLGSGDIVVSASPAGSSGQVQYNNAGAFGGAAAVVYATTGTHVTVTAKGATIVPVCVKGAASQSANLHEWRNSANTLLAYIDAYGWITGSIYLPSSEKIFGQSGNITLTTHTGAGTFNLLRFGGATSATPAFKISGTTIIVRLGDDSADTNFKAAKLNLSNLPTSNPAVAGDVWNDGGTLKISAG